MKKIISKMAQQPKIYDALRNFLEGGFKTQKRIIQKELNLAENETVLDIGCGTGDHSIFFKPDQYTGLDITSEYINKASQKYPDKWFICANADHLPFPNQNFDYIFIAQTFHHLSDGQIQGILKEAKRVLKDTGKLVVLDQTTTSGKQIITRILQNFDEGNYIRSANEYKKLILESFNLHRQYSACSRFYPLEIFVVKKEAVINEKTENTTPELSVVILCYKNHNWVKKLTDKLTDLLTKEEIDYELILVGNYNQGDMADPTPKLVQEIANQNKRIKCLTLVKQGMMGWDMRTGLEAATGKYIAVIDGDDQMPMEDIIRVYKRIKENNYDIVKTHRTTRTDSIKRKIVSLTYNFIFNLLFPGMKIKDANSKPKILLKEAYKKMRLLSDGWTIDAEMMIQARRMDMLVEEIPTDFFKLEGGRQSFVKFGAILEFISDLIDYRLKEWTKKKS